MHNYTASPTPPPLGMCRWSVNVYEINTWRALNLILRWRTSENMTNSNLS